MPEIPIADSGLGVGEDRPIEAETVPKDAAITLGGMNSVGFVDQAGIVLETEEAVGKTDRNVDDVAVFGG